jgi:hypothetical protein
MSYYIPYDERLRRTQEADSRETRRAGVQHHGSAQRVNENLAKLGGLRTNAYLEILQPAKGFRRLLNRGTVISKPGVVGGPEFVITEVLKAYRIPNAIVWASRNDVPKQAFDAL